MREAKPEGEVRGFTDVTDLAEAIADVCGLTPATEVNGQPPVADHRAVTRTDARRCTTRRSAASPATTTPASTPRCSRRSPLANGGHQVAYGEDVYTAHLQDVFRSHFGAARRGVPGLQRHRRQRRRAAGDDRPLGRGDLRRVRAHQRRRVRRAGAGRRAEAAHRAHPGRQAHPRADRPAGVGLRTTSTAPSRRSSRSPRAPSSAPATRPRRSRRSASTPTSAA